MSKNFDRKPIQFTEDEMKRMQKLTCDDPGLVSFATSIGSGKVAPLEESVIRSQSCVAMNEQINIQMEQIVDQIRLLAKQVESLQKRKKISEEIYLSKMNFEPVIGNTYYLYSNSTVKKNVLSMIAPSEWGASGQNLTFVAEVVLLADRTWKMIKQNSSLIFDSF